MENKQEISQNYSKWGTASTKMIVCGLTVIVFLIYMVIELDSLDSRFERVKFGSEMAEVEKIMGRPSDGSWLPVKNVHVWQKKKMSFTWSYPFIKHIPSKIFIVEFSSQCKVVKKEEHSQ